MIKIIVNYKIKKRNGREYLDPLRSVILTFDKIEDVTMKNINNEFGSQWIDILEMKQIIDYND